MHITQLAQAKTHSKLIYSLGFLLLSTFSLHALCIEATTLTDPESLGKEWQSFNASTVNNYILPAYQSLEKNTKSLNSAINDLCLAEKKPTEALEKARDAFHQTMDAWQFIQNIQFGPIQVLMRNYSMQFWPDKKNHVGKHLTSLLETNDLATLTEDEFHKASVSIKGLPAIERFLFDDDETQQLINKPFHCHVLKRISSYTEGIGHDLVIEWKEMKMQFTYVSDDGYFESDIDAATALLKALVEPIEVIRDLKLLRPLGSEFGQQKMKRLESWRSQRSLRNIEMNIASLNDLYKNLDGIVDKTENRLLNEKFMLVLKQIKTMKSPIELSIETKAGYQEILNLSDSLKTLHALLEKVINNQGIHLGFNSRDGD